MIEVGDPVKDHECWVRPENMRTTRTVLKIDQSSPGTEIAAETCAALAAASVVFRHVDYAYARQLANRAKLVFLYAIDHLERYSPLLSRLHSYMINSFSSFSSLQKHIREPMMENVPSIALSQALM